MQVLIPYMSCICYSAEEEETAKSEGYKEIYSIGPEGMFKTHIFRGEGRFIRLKVDNIPGVKVGPARRQEICFLPQGKIPYQIWEQIIGFFKKIMEVKKEEVEAMIHVLYNAERGYHIGVPPQRVSKASASYDWDYIPSGTSIIVDVHSHNTMNAFFSGTDERDDANNIGFSGVVGKLKDKEPMVVMRFNYFKQKYDVKLADIFEEPPPPPAIEIPEEWLEKVTTPSYNYGGYGGYGSGTTHPGYTSRRAEHLKPYRFQKQSNDGQAGEVNGNRVGPHLRQAGFQTDLDPYGDSELGGVWGDLGMAPVPTKQLNSVEQNVKPISEKTEGHSEKLSRADLTKIMTEGVDDEVVPGLPASTATNEVITKPQQVEIKPRQDKIPTLEGSCVSEDHYAVIAINHGTKAADAFTLISDCMGELSGNDDLLNELTVDMFSMLAARRQLPLFKELYESLPAEDQLRISTNGL